MLKYIGFALLAIALVLIGFYIVVSQQESVPRETSVKGEFVSYFGDMRGYYAEPVEAGEYPGVIMVHEWWGLNDTIAGAAEELAKEGYRVLAVDLFGSVATTPAEAGVLRNSVDQQEAIENMKAAEKFLRDKGAEKVASLGWCFGGGQALQLALSEGENLDASVIYYGTPMVTDSAQLQKITWPLLGVFGDADTAIPVSTINAFKQALADAGVENEVYVYPGVGHAFANPSNANHAPEETRDAWGKTLAFLEKHLK